MNKILVTGADGFIGSHLAESLAKKNYDVKALVQYNSFNSWGWLEKSEIRDNLEIISGDIRDKNFCMSITKNIEKIFNLAALIAIPYSYQAPSSYIETNTMGTLNLCEAAITNNVNEFIQMSTSEVYGSAQYLPIDELHPTVAQSPYSASKIAAEAVVTSFNKSFDLNTKIARVFNTYGPRQSARAIIPTIICQLLSESEFLNIGGLQPTRDLNYVIDTCNGLISLANSKKATSKTVNIGSNKRISINDLSIMIMEIMGINKKLYINKTRLRPNNSEVNDLQCDDGLMKSLTGFEPKYNLKNGLKETINWFTDKNNLSNYKLDLYNI